MSILFVFFPHFHFLGGIFGGAGVLLLCCYFLPTLVALMRKRANTGAIFILNFFLGWTFIGWIVSLIWAVAGDAPPQQVVVTNTVTTEKKATIPTIRPTPAATDKLNQLRQLKDLLDEGALTQEEFNQQKARILN